MTSTTNHTFSGRGRAKGEKFDPYETVQNRILEHLENGQSPWRRTWQTTGGIMPSNLISGNEYRGVNAFLTMLSGHESPYWLTFKQAKDLGGHIKKGQKSTMVVFWRFFDRDKNDTTGELDPARPPLLRVYSVFNTTQAEGLKSARLTDFENQDNLIPNEHDRIAAADDMIKNMDNAPLIEHASDQPSYSPRRDIVRMPVLGKFDTPQDYYSTFFHELSHATGHESRLKRPDMEHVTPYGSTSYSKEELIAELAAALVSGITGLWSDDTEKNSAAYLRGWARKLRQKESAKWFIQCAGAAQKAADYILNKPAYSGDSQGQQGQNTATEEIK